MKKYDFLQETFQVWQDNTHVLKQLGSEGWHIVGIFPFNKHTEALVFFFEKELEQ